MGDFTMEELQEALRSIASMIDRSEQAREKFAPGTSQHTLQKNRIKALYVVSSLIKKESAENATTAFIKEDFEDAVKPIASLISKSEKAQKKLAQGTWQHRMLEDNLKALYIASPLLAKALEEN